jgi:predicted nucleotidyltransferase
MDLLSLLAGTSLSPALRQTIDQLVARKAAATERDLTPRIALLDALFEATLHRPEERVEAPNRSAVEARIDSLFQALALSGSVY